MDLQGKNLMTSAFLVEGKDRPEPPLTPLSSLERDEDDDLEQISEAHDDDGFNPQPSQ